MRRLPLVLTAATTVVCAEILLPVRSGSIEKTPIPIPLSLPGPGAQAAFDRAIGPHTPSLARTPDIGIPSHNLGNSSQTMGAGEVDLLLEPGDPAGGEAVDAGDDGEDIGGGMPPEDPFAEEEPIDERALRPPGEWFVEYRDNLSEGALEPRGPIDRAEVARLFERIGNDPEDGEGATPANAPQTGAAAPTATPSSTLRTPPPKDPRAAAYDARVQQKFEEVEAVRLRSNPPGAPLDPSGIAAVVSNEGRMLQSLNLDPGLDAPLRDSRNTEVTRSTVLGLILVRNMYIAMARALADVFDRIREGDIAYKRERTQAIYEVSTELVRLRAAADSAKSKYDGALRSAASTRGYMSEAGARALAEGIDRAKRESEAATAAFNAAMDRAEKQYPELNVLVDGVPLWQSVTTIRGDGVSAQLDRVQIYNGYLQQGATDLRNRAAAAGQHDTMDELMDYGRPEFANVRHAVRLDGRSVGSTLTDLLMSQVEGIHAAYDIHRSVDIGWTKVLLATTGIGLIVGGWFILPLSAVAYGCLGVSVVDVTLEGSELVVRYSDARSMEEAGPIVGWRHVVSAQDRESAAVGHTILAAVGVGIDTAVVRSIRVVGPGQCAGAVAEGGNVADAQRAADVAAAAGAARAADAAPPSALRADDITYWRGREAAEIERLKGYGHVIDDASDAKLAELDGIVQAAERAGIPRPVIDEGLNRIRDTPVSMVNELERQAGSFTPFDLAIKDFRIRMVIAEAIEKGFTIVSRIEDTAYLSKLGGAQAKMLILEPAELNRIVAKAAVDRGAGAIQWTRQEADLANQVLNADAARLYVFDPQQAEGGLYLLMDADDLANLRQFFGPEASRPATIVDAPPPSGPPPDLPSRPIDPEADTHLEMLNPEKHQTQVLRPEEIGEYPLDAPTVRFPADEADRTPTQVLRPEEIGEYPLDAPTVRFPADEADRTPTQVLRPEEIGEYPLDAPTVRFPADDAARPAAGAAPDCPRIGPCGPNEIIGHADDPAAFIRRQYGDAGEPAANAYEIVVRELGPQNVDGIAGGFAQGRARAWSWPAGTDYMQAKRMDKFGGQLYDPKTVAMMPPDAAQAYAKARELGGERLPSDLDIPVDDAVDVGRLEEVARQVYDETGVLIEFTSSRIRGEAPGNVAGGAPPPPVPPGGPAGGAAANTPPPLSELDKQVIQKGFREAGGQAVEWTPEELTRLQQMAYPAPGMRPSVLQRRLMPVAEQRGGRLDTMRVNPDDIGAVRDQAIDAFLARQELDDMSDLARQFGVPEERILLQTQGLTDDAQATVLERASRGLLREIDRARGIVYESGVPDDYFVITRMFFAAKTNGNRLLEADAAWLKQRMDADETFIQRLATREFDDAAGESHTIMDPESAQQLESMYRSATGGGGAPVSQGPPPTIDPGSGGAASMLGGPSGRGGADAPVEVVILSTEGSTGPVMEAFFVNRLGQGLRVQGEGIVLEPVAEVDASTLQRIEQIREAALQGKPVPPPAAGAQGAGPMEDPWTGASVVRVVLDAYCLEADLPVPTRGMLYRIAEPARQAAFGSLRPILEASQRLHEQGALHPSNDPVDYFHSIRQWAIWADEKDMDEEEFEDAFTEHARRNITGSGQAWTPEVERIVRDYAPGRWGDVEAVLLAAGVR